MRKRQRDLIAELERLGYGYDHTNAKNFEFYVHEDTGCEVKVPTGCDEQVSRSIIRQARHQIGLPTKEGKRNPAQIRERNAAEHARAAADLKRLAEQRESASPALLREVEEAYLRAERRFRYWDRMMRQVAS